MRSRDKIGRSVASCFPQNVSTIHSFHALLELLVHKSLNLQVSLTTLPWSSHLLEPVDKYTNQRGDYE